MKPITFLFPTLAEIPQSLRKHYQPKKPLSPSHHSNVFFTRIGMGQYAIKNIQKISQQLTGHTVVLIGYGGGLSPSLTTGQMVMCTSLHTDSQPKIELANECPNIGDNQKLLLGACYSAPKVISSVSEKQSLYQKGFDLVDMENYFVYQELKSIVSSFYVFRIILDSATDNLPDLSDTVKADGDISLLKTIRHIILHPQHLPSLIHLGFVTPRLTTKIETFVERWVNDRNRS